MDDNEHQCGQADGEPTLTAEDLTEYQRLCELVRLIGRGYVQTKIDESGAALFEIRITVIPPSRRELATA